MSEGDFIHAENSNEVDAHAPVIEDVGSIELATVGWDDAADWFDQGSSGNDGTTLVRVQTYRGKLNGEPVTPGVAQGHKYLVQITGPLWRMPRKGERVVVAFPAGMRETPGAGAIIATLGASPPIQFSPTRAKMDFGSDYDLIIKARSITLSDYSNRFVVVGPDTGIHLNDGSGNVFAIKDGSVNAIASGGFNFVVGSTGTPSLAGLSLSTSASAMWCGIQLIKLNVLNIGTWCAASISLAAGNIGLGSSASPATPASYFPGVPSTSVFVQP